MAHLIFKEGKKSEISPYDKMVSYGELRDSLLSEFLIICLQFFWIIRTPKEIIDRNVEIVRNAFQ